MTFDTTYLTRGQYKVCAVLYEMSDFGAYEDYDAVWPFFTFEITEDTVLNWSQKLWGHVQFPMLDVQEISPEF